MIVIVLRYDCDALPGKLSGAGLVMLAYGTAVLCTPFVVDVEGANEDEELCDS